MTRIRLGRHDEAIVQWREMKRRGLAVDPQVEAWMRENAIESQRPPER